MDRVLGRLWEGESPIFVWDVGGFTGDCGMVCVCMSSQSLGADLGDVPWSQGALA